MESESSPFLCLKYGMGTRFILIQKCLTLEKYISKARHFITPPYLLKSYYKPLFINSVFTSRFLIAVAASA